MIRSEDDLIESNPPVIVYVVTKLFILANPEDTVYMLLFSPAMLIEDGLLNGGGKFGKGPVVEDWPKDIAGVKMLYVRITVPRNTDLEYFLFVIVKNL